MKRSRPKRKRRKRLSWIERGYKDFYDKWLKIPRNAAKKPSDFDTAVRSIYTQTEEDQEELFKILDHEFEVNWIRADQFTEADREHVFYMEDFKQRVLGRIDGAKMIYHQDLNKWVPADTLTDIKMRVRELLDLYPLHLWKCFNCGRYFVLPFIRGGQRKQQACSDPCRKELNAQKRSTEEAREKKRRHDAEYYVL